MRSPEVAEERSLGKGNGPEGESETQFPRSRAIWNQTDGSDDFVGRAGRTGGLSGARQAANAEINADPQKYKLCQDVKVVPSRISRY